MQELHKHAVGGQIASKSDMLDMPHLSKGFSEIFLPYYLAAVTLLNMRNNEESSRLKKE
jgi:hypothetical protein